METSTARAGYETHEAVRKKRRSTAVRLAVFFVIRSESRVRRSLPIECLHVSKSTVCSAVMDVLWRILPVSSSSMMESQPGRIWRVFGGCGGRVAVGGGSRPTVSAVAFASFGDITADKRFCHHYSVGSAG